MEKLLRLDLLLALRAKAVAHRYDLILAGSEKLGNSNLPLIYPQAPS
jgi:hypothetical protein